MTKKLNTKKVNHGHSVTLATACKKAITKTCRLYKNADTKIAVSYGVTGETYELALCMVKLMDASKAKTLTAYLKKVIGAGKLEAFGYGNNDFSALIKFGRDIQNKDHQKWVDVQGDGVGRKPQGVLKRLKDKGTGTNPKATGDIDKWIASVIASAVKRGLSNAQLMQKIVTACGGQSTIKTQSQGTTNVNEILKPSYFENKKRSKK